MAPCREFLPWRTARSLWQETPSWTSIPDSLCLLSAVCRYSSTSLTPSRPPGQRTRKTYPIASWLLCSQFSKVEKGAPSRLLPQPRRSCQGSQRGSALNHLELAPRAAEASLRSLLPDRRLEAQETHNKQRQSRVQILWPRLCPKRQQSWSSRRQTG